MVNYSQLVQTLRTLRSENVVASQQYFLQQSKNQYFIDMLCEVIISGEQDWIKILASTIINRAIVQNRIQTSYDHIYQILYKILIHGEIKPIIKRCFQRSIIKQLENNQQAVICDWCALIMQMISDFKDRDAIYLLIACFAVSDCPLFYMSKIIKQFYVKSLTQLQIGINNAGLLHELIKMWLVVWNSLQKQLEQQQTKDNQKKIKQILNIISQSSQTYEFTNKMLEFEAQNTYLCTIQGLQQLNMLKYEACELLKKIATYGSEEDIDIIFIYLDPFIPKITQTLSLIALNKTYLEICQSEELITSLIGLYGVIYKKDPEKFINQWKNILHLIVYPLLEINDQQRLIFEQRIQQFNSLCQDCCDRQVFGILKTQTARLLQIIGDNSAHGIEYSLDYSIESLKVQLGFITNTDNKKVLPIETSLMILSIYSYAISKYPRSIQDMRIILLDQRSHDLDNLQISRIFLFLAYNYSQIFRSLQSGEQWIQLALQYNKHPTTSYCGLDFISNIVDEYFSINFFRSIYHKLIGNQLGILWIIINKIINSHAQSISQDHMCQLVVTLFQRLQFQFSHPKQTTIHIINALHLLKLILDVNLNKSNPPIYYCQNKNQLLSLIWKSTQIYHKAIPLKLDDQIVKIINSFLKIQFPPLLFDFLPSIYTQFSKDGFCDSSYLNLFNTLTMLLTELPQLESLWKVLSTALMHYLLNRQVGINKDKIFIGNLLIIIQNFLAVHGSKLQNQVFYQTSSVCLNLIPRQPNQTIYNKFLLCRALNIELLCHIYLRGEAPYEYIRKYQELFSSYDARVLVKLLNQVIFFEGDFETVVELINILITVVARNTKPKTKKKLKKTSKLSHKIQDFQKILKHINTPFLEGNCNEDELKNILTRMKHSNGDLYSNIINKLPVETRTNLHKLIGSETIVNGKGRVIRKIKAARIGNSIDDDLDENMEQDEEDQNLFKRKRVVMKNEKKLQGNKS